MAPKTLSLETHLLLLSLHSRNISFSQSPKYLTSFTFVFSVPSTCSAFSPSTSWLNTHTDARACTHAKHHLFLGEWRKDFRRKWHVSWNLKKEVRYFKLEREERQRWDRRPSRSRCWPVKKQGVLGWRASWSAAVCEVPNKTGTSVGAQFPRVCHQGQYPAGVCRGNTQKGK